MQQIQYDDRYMEPVILIQKDKSEILTNNSLMLIKGNVGSGKSRLAMNLMRGLLIGKEDLGFEYIPCPEGKHVIYVSTEMSKYHLQKRYRKITENLSVDYRQKLVFLDASDVPLANKLNELKADLVKFPPYVIIIDQLADFVSDINNIEQANSIASTLMNGLDQPDCAIIGIIHQNEDSGSSTKARGHLGSVFEQKVVCSIAISSSNNGFKLRTTKMREGHPFEMNMIFNKETEMLTLTSSNLEEKVITLSYPISRTNLLKCIQGIENCEKRTAENRLKILRDKEFLIEKKEGKEIIFILNPNKNGNNAQ